MKKLFVLCLIMIMLIANTACDNINAQTLGTGPKIVMVAPSSVWENEALNRSAYDGIHRASDEYKIDIPIVEPKTYKDYLETLSETASEGADLIIALGRIGSKELSKIAGDSPDTMFAVVGSDSITAENVMNLSFKDEEGAFLIGIIAALTTETQKLGFIGGVKNEASQAFEYGYRGGVKAINPQAEVEVKYIGSFDDRDEGKEVAKEVAFSIIDKGVDIIFHLAGESGEGVIEAAKEKEIWAVGVEEYNSITNPDTVLCSMFKRVDNGVYLSVQNFMEGKFSGGIYEFGLDFEAVGYIDNGKKIKKEIKTHTNKYVSAIMAGSIIVPKNKNDLESFTVTEDMVPKWSVEEL